MNCLLNCLLYCLLNCLLELPIVLPCVLLDCFDCLGPGPLGAPGPKIWDTRGECNYLLSGKLPTVRQATYCQAGYQPYQRCTQKAYTLHPNVSAYFAPNNRIHAPNRSIDMHPKGIDMHPKVSIDLHPTTAYFAPKRAKTCTQKA